MTGPPTAPDTPGEPPPPPPQALPPLPPGYGTAPPPAGRPSRLSRRLLIVLGVIVALVVVAGIGAAVARSHTSGNYPIVSSSSTDGTFKAGDCVSLSTTRVTQADCGRAHDAQIIQVLHGTETCPAGTTEFQVTDGTGNLCLDKSNNSKG